MDVWVESRQSAATLKDDVSRKLPIGALFQSRFFSKEASLVALKRYGSNDGTFEARNGAEKGKKGENPPPKEKTLKKLTERPGGQRDVAAHAGDAGQNPKPEGALPGEPAGPGRAQGRRGPAVVEGVGQGLHRPEEHWWEFLKVLFFFRGGQREPERRLAPFFFVVPPLFPLLERVRLHSKWTKNLSLSLSLSLSRARTRAVALCCCSGALLHARARRGKRGRGRASFLLAKILNNFSPSPFEALSQLFSFPMLLLRSSRLALARSGSFSSKATRTPVVVAVSSPSRKAEECAKDERSGSGSNKKRSAASASLLSNKQSAASSVVASALGGSSSSNRGGESLSPDRRTSEALVAALQQHQPESSSSKALSSSSSPPAPETAGGVEQSKSDIQALAARLWTAYDAALTSHPVAVKSATSFVGFFLGDLIAQSIVGLPYDARRTLRLVSFGVFMDGPIGKRTKGVTPTAVCEHSHTSRT